MCCILRLAAVVPRAVCPCKSARVHGECHTAGGCGLTWLCAVEVMRWVASLSRVAWRRARALSCARGACVEVCFSQVRCMVMSTEGSTDGSTVITGDEGNSVIVWDASTLKRNHTEKADAPVRRAPPCGRAL